jgi:hypothetical protein
MTHLQSLTSHMDQTIPRHSGTKFLVGSVCLFVTSFLAMVGTFVWIIGGAVVENGGRGGAAPISGVQAYVGWAVGGIFLLSMLMVAMAVCVKIGSSGSRTYRQAYVWFGWSVLAMALVPALVLLVR